MEQNIFDLSKKNVQIDGAGKVAPTSNSGLKSGTISSTNTEPNKSTELPKNKWDNIEPKTYIKYHNNKDKYVSGYVVNIIVSKKETPNKKYIKLSSSLDINNRTRIWITGFDTIKAIYITNPPKNNPTPQTIYKSEEDHKECETKFTGIISQIEQIKIDLRRVMDDQTRIIQALKAMAKR